VSVCLCIAFDQSTVVSLPSVTAFVSTSNAGPYSVYTNVKMPGKQDWDGSTLACAVTADMTTYESQIHRSAEARGIHPDGVHRDGILCP
jgi:hypothetical protein